MPATMGRLTNVDFLLQHKERGFNDFSYNDHDYDVCDPNDAD
jgi:hypothetical protein